MSLTDILVPSQSCQSARLSNHDDLLQPHATNKKSIENGLLLTSQSTDAFGSTKFMSGLHFAKPNTSGLDSIIFRNSYFDC